MMAHASTSPAPELRQALAACRGSFLAAGIFSLFVNLLLLVPAFYMLEVYDRVLPSSSESTLVMLSGIAVFLFAVMGLLEWVRSQILIAASTRIDAALGPRVFDAIFARTLATSGRVSSAQPLGDLMQVRQFLTGTGLFAFFDTPWLPVYIGVMFLFHPAFGALAIVSALVLLALAVWGEMATRSDLERSTQLSNEAALHTQQQLRNAEVIEAMGMLPRVRERWARRQADALAHQVRASRRGALAANSAKVFRLTIQSLVLGLGAWLAIHRQLSPGILIAGAILLGRALAPLDLMIAGWRGFQGARAAYGRLDALLGALPARTEPMTLPPPMGALAFDRVTVQPAGAAAPVLRGVHFALDPGASLALVGPSGAGKSTLLRAALGLHTPQAGHVRIDGAELTQWPRSQLGPRIGYLPQDVELLDGTVSENIARFGDVDAQSVVAAAQAAGVHDMILRLPQGYETPLTGGGRSLSAGQSQRIGLARALYRDPCLVLLDEPNANLDQEGEAALLTSLAALKARGCTVVVVTHRTQLLDRLELMGVLVDGQLTRFGPREKVLEALRHPVSTLPAVQAPVLRAAGT